MKTSKINKKIVLIGFIGLILNIVIIALVVNFNKAKKIESILNTFLNKDIQIGEGFKTNVSTKTLFKCSTNLNLDLSCNVNDIDLVLFLEPAKQLNKIKIDSIYLNLKTGLFNYSINNILNSNSVFEFKIKPNSDSVEENDIFSDILINMNIETEKLFKNNSMYTIDLELFNKYFKIDQRVKLMYVVNKDIKEYFIFEKDNKFFESDFVMKYKDEFRIIENSGSLNSKNNDKIINYFYNIYKDNFAKMSDQEKRLFNISYLDYNSSLVMEKELARKTLVDLIKIASVEYAYTDKSLYINFIQAVLNDKNRVYTATIAKDNDLALPYSYIQELSNKNPEKAYELTRERYNYILE